MTAAELSIETEACYSRSPEVIRALSAFYTPEETAALVARVALVSGRERILEPSAGSGSLIWAALKRSAELCGVEAAQVVACDINPSAIAEIRAAKSKNISTIAADFLQLGSDSIGLFDLVIANPPFTRNHQINPIRREELRRRFGVSGAAGIWVHFLLHAMAFLKDGGRLVSIVPRSILFSDYAKAFLRTYRSKFKTVDVLSFRNRIEWHGGADEPGALIIASGFAEISETVDGNPERWGDGALESFCSQHPDSMSELGSIARIGIGFVTGRNSLFLMSDEERDIAGISVDDVTPSITRARHVRGVRVTRHHLINLAKRGEKTLLLTPRRLTPPIKRRLGQLSDDTIDAVAWFKKRSPWWRVELGSACDAVFTCMSHMAPRIAMVSSGVGCANTLHRMDFSRGVSKGRRSAVVISSYSSFGQLQFERIGRTYGRGLLKIEPSALKSWLVPKVEEFDPTLLQRFVRSISSGEGDSMRLADELILSPIVGSKWRGLSDSLACELKEVRLDRLRNISGASK